MNDMHILVLGTGSAGKRHAKNFASLGCRISAMDPRSDRLDEAAQAVSLVGGFTGLEQALGRASHFDGVVVCSPPKFHVEQSMAFVAAGVPVLLEKPVSPTLASAQRLKQLVDESGVPLLLGYTYRWWPPLIEMRRRLEEIGPLHHARFVMSAHLEDWHPWERYQDFFMASRDLGGGALLDESHFIDLMIWFFGMPDSISGRVERLSRLEIDTDDNVDLICVHGDRLRTTIHLDLYGRPHEKSITIIGGGGALQCLFNPDLLRFCAGAEGAWQTTPFDCQRNDMFVAVARDFLDMLAGKEPICGIEDGIRVLMCIEAARESTLLQREVAL